MLSPDQFAVHDTGVTVSLRGNGLTMPSEHDALTGGGDACHTSDTPLVNQAEHGAVAPLEEHVAVMSSADAADAPTRQPPNAARTTTTASRRLMPTTPRSAASPAAAASCS